MKKVPYDTFKSGDKVFHTPTVEACQNFVSYLDKEELEFYKGLGPADALSISLSCDPFRTFDALFRNINDIPAS